MSYKTLYSPQYSRTLSAVLSFADEGRPRPSTNHSWFLGMCPYTLPWKLRLAISRTLSPSQWRVDTHVPLSGGELGNWNVMQSWVNAESMCGISSCSFICRGTLLGWLNCIPTASNISFQICCKSNEPRGGPTLILAYGRRYLKVPMHGSQCRWPLLWLRNCHASPFLSSH